MCSARPAVIAAQMRGKNDGLGDYEVVVNHRARWWWWLRGGLL